MTDQELIQALRAHADWAKTRAAILLLIPRYAYTVAMVLGLPLADLQGSPIGCQFRRRRR